VTVTVTVTVAEPLEGFCRAAGHARRASRAVAGRAVGVLSVQDTVYRAMEDRVDGRNAAGARRKTGKARSVLYLTDWCYQR
jgi:hypothetical protein